MTPASVKRCGPGLTSDNVVLRKLLHDHILPQDAGGIVAELSQTPADML
jgi:hypothetical protein